MQDDAAIHPAAHSLPAAQPVTPQKTVAGPTKSRKSTAKCASKPRATPMQAAPAGVAYHQGPATDPQQAAAHELPGAGAAAVPGAASAGAAAPTHAGGVPRRQSICMSTTDAAAITEVAGLGAAGESPGQRCLRAAAASMPTSSLHGQGLITHPTGSRAAAAASSQSKLSHGMTHAAESDGQASVQDAQQKPKQHLDILTWLPFVLAAPGALATTDKPGSANVHFNVVHHPQLARASQLIACT